LGPNEFFFLILGHRLHHYFKLVASAFFIKIYHLLKEQKDDLCLKQAKANNEWSKDILDLGKRLQEDITALRDIRAKHQLKNSEKFDFLGAAETQLFYNHNDSLRILLEKQTNSINTDKEFIEKTIEEIAQDSTIVVSSQSKFFIFLNKQLDKSQLKNELEKDLEHQKGFLQSVIKKLSNEKFVANAKPEVIALEQKKKTDAEARIKTIEESLVNLG
jgi:valyl-tRNA synthetase